MKKTALFLIQAKAGLPRIYRCLKNKPHLLLSYQKETADTAIYAPDTTWTSGRNKLIEHVKANGLQYDWYVFLDEDVVFAGMSQKAGFEMFLSVLSVTGHPVVTAAKGDYNRRCNQERLDGIVPAAMCKKGVENPRWALQTVDWFDGLFNAFSREAFFNERLLPYEDKFDGQSWWASQFITILRANHIYRNRIVQCNKICVRNTQYSDYARGFEIFGAACRHALAQLGVDAVEMSAGGEVKPDARYPKPFLFNLRCRVFGITERVRRFIYGGRGGGVINRLVKRPVKRLFNR